MSKVTIERAVEALTFSVGGKTYVPPLLDELRADAILDNVIKILGAAQIVSGMRAELLLNDVEDQSVGCADWLYVEHLLLRSLQHALVVAQQLMESGPEA